MVKRDYHAEYLRRKTRGRHPKEEQKYGKTRPKRTGVGKIPKPPRIPKQKKVPRQTWNTAYYASPLKAPERDVSYFTMSSYDYMKTSWAQYGKKRQKALHALHKFFQEYIEDFQNLYAEPQAYSEVRFEYDSEPGDEMVPVDSIRRDLIRFEWVLYDVTDPEPRVAYFLQYQKGQIRASKLPVSFDRVNFVMTIKSWGLWK